MIDSIYTFRNALNGDVVILAEDMNRLIRYLNSRDSDCRRVKIVKKIKFPEISYEDIVGILLTIKYNIWRSETFKILLSCFTNHFNDLTIIGIVNILSLFTYNKLKVLFNLLKYAKIDERDIVVILRVFIKDEDKLTALNFILLHVHSYINSISKCNYHNILKLLHYERMERVIYLFKHYSIIVL